MLFWFIIPTIYICGVFTNITIRFIVSHQARFGSEKASGGHQPPAKTVRLSPPRPPLLKQLCHCRGLSLVSFALSARTKRLISCGSDWHPSAEWHGSLVEGNGLHHVHMCIYHITQRTGTVYVTTVSFFSRAGPTARLQYVRGSGKHKHGFRKCWWRASLCRGFRHGRKSVAPSKFDSWRPTRPDTAHTHTSAWRCCSSCTRAACAATARRFSIASTCLPLAFVKIGEAFPPPPASPGAADAAPPALLLLLRSLTVFCDGKCQADRGGGGYGGG